MTSPLAAAIIVAIILTILLGIIRATRWSLQNIVLTLAGAIIGLTIGALLSIPLGNLAAPYGTVLPLGLSLSLMIITVLLVLGQRKNLLHLMPLLRVPGADASRVSSVASKDILVDTSAIIDGRLVDIAKAGFIPGRLLVPRFVLAELQNIADSEDAMRRSRGRRGLEMLNTARDTEGLASEIIEDDAPEIKAVDAKLVALARRRGADVLTTDFNLNRVAQIEGVRVLNVNELANAIRPVVIPGEQMLVKVVQAGKERGQGVGYLTDGTMIVVEQGDKLIGQEVPTEVTRVFQTVAGKMIFTAPIGQGSRSDSRFDKSPSTKNAHRQHRDPSKSKK